MRVWNLGVLLGLAFVLWGLSASAEVPTSWYDLELVHNGVHDLEEALEKFAPRLTKSDTEPLHKRFKAYQKSVIHLHDEMSDYDKEQSAVIITKAFQGTIKPFESFLSAVRGNQLKQKERMRYANEALDLVYLQGQISFWMTPSPPETK